MSGMRKPKLPGVAVPSHLQAAGQRLFRATAEAFVIEDEHHRVTLLLACEHRDRAEAARVVVERDGMTYADTRGVVRPRPEVLIQKESTIVCARLLRELGLDVHEPDERRPPKIMGRASLRVAP